MYQYFNYIAFGIIICAFRASPPPPCLWKQAGLSGKGGVGGIEHLTQCDISEQALLRGVRGVRDFREARRGAEVGDATGVDVGTTHVLVDEEFLPFPPGSFDLVLR